MIIYTYGGGELFINVFQGIAMLHNGGVLKQLFSIAGMLGMVLVVIKAFSNVQSPLEMIRGWMLPVMVGYGIIFTPTTSVVVKDIVTQRFQNVDHVPYGLALVSRVSSYLGYHITAALEQVLHVPGNLQYNRTGHIFGAEQLMEIANFKWVDATAENNMRNFVVNCISYDVMLGRYEMDDLRKRSNLWPFINERTSQTRGLYWISKTQGTAGQRTTEYCSCRTAANRLNEVMNLEVAEKQRHRIFMQMPMAFQALTGLAQSAESLLRQQLLLHSLVEGVEQKSAALGLGHNVALQRAYLQQQSTLMLTGSMANKSVVITRTVFEAFILLAFIFVVPMLALPMGMNYFMKWAEMVIWINLWPPIYALLNFILQSAAQSRARALMGVQETVISGTTPPEAGISLSNLVPLANLYNEMVAYAGWASLFVPMLAYMIMKGGMASMVQMAGSMMQASQGAVAAAAQDQATGNYSYGNVSLGNMQYNNAQMNQQGLSARFSDGYFQESTGDYDMTYTRSGGVMDQKLSQLPVNFSVSQNVSSAYQRRAESSLQSAYSEGASYSSSMGDAIRELSSLDQHMGSSLSATQGMTTSQDHSMQQSAQKVQSYAKDLSERYGISEERAMQLMVGINPVTGIKNLVSKVPIVGQAVSGFMDAIGLTSDISYKGGASRTQMFEDAHRIAHSQEFQENISRIQHYGEQHGYSEGLDQGHRQSDSLSSSFEQARQHQSNMNQNLSEAESYSKSASYAKENSVRLDQNYNREFWDFFTEKAGGTPKAIEIWNSPNEHAKNFKAEKIQEFQTMMEQKAMKEIDARIASDRSLYDATSNMTQQHDKSVERLTTIDHRDHDQNVEEMKIKSEFNPQDIRQTKDDIAQQLNQGRSKVDATIDQLKTDLNNKEDNMRKDFNKSNSESTIWKGTKAFFNPSEFKNNPSSKNQENSSDLNLEHNDSSSHKKNYHPSYGRKKGKESFHGRRRKNTLNQDE